MELEINHAFLKHYNEYRSKEEAAKTTKVLKRQIKEMEESSSSSSDSEFEECYKSKFVEQCDSILQKISNIGSDVLKVNAPLFNEIIVDKKNDETVKPVYARDLNRKILLENKGLEDENDLRDMEKASKLESDDIVNQFKKEEFKLLDLDNVSDDEEFLKPTKNQKTFNVPQEIEQTVLESVDSDSCDEELDVPLSAPTIQINRDRRIETVRVSKTLSRAEKRKKRKENKEKDLKEKMKRLKEIKNKSLLEKLEKVKKNIPEMAEFLNLEDMDDDDFDVQEYSRKMTEIFEKESSKMPIDNEKPVFSDDSDMDNIPLLNDDFDEDESLVMKSKLLNKKSNNPTTKSVEKDSYFTNIAVETEKDEKPKKKIGILSKNIAESFDPKKYKSYQQYLKKTFDFFCEDIISGKNDEDDILCKFKFRNVEEQSYGLDVEEIILADNKELNKWASLKKIVSLRNKDEEERDRKKYSHESMQGKKREILKSLYEEVEEEDGVREEDGERNEHHSQEVESEQMSKSTKKRMRKLANKKRLKQELVSVQNSTERISQEEIAEEKNSNEDQVVYKKVKKSKNNQNETSVSEEPAIKKKKSEYSAVLESNESNMDLNVRKSKKSKENKKENEKNNKTENLDEKLGVKKSKKSKTEKVSEITESTNKNKNISEAGEGSISKSVENRSLGQEEKIKEKKEKKKAKKSTTVPVLSENRLASFGIKPGFYKYVMCDKKKNEK